MTKYTGPPAEVRHDFAVDVFARTVELQTSVTNTHNLYEAGLCTLDELDSDLVEIRYDFALDIQSLVTEALGGAK